MVDRLIMRKKLFNVEIFYFNIITWPNIKTIYANEVYEGEDIFSPVTFHVCLHVYYTDGPLYVYLLLILLLFSLFIKKIFTYL